MVLFWLIGVCDGWAVVLQGAGRPKISFWTESHLPCSLSYVHVHRATLVLHVAHSACIILNCLYIVRLWASLRGAHHRHVTLDMFLYFQTRTEDIRDTAKKGNRKGTPLKNKNRHSKNQLKRSRFTHTNNHKTKGHSKAPPLDHPKEQK